MVKLSILEYAAKQFACVNDILLRRYPAMVNRKRIILQRDNAKPEYFKENPYENK